MPRSFRTLKRLATERVYKGQPVEVIQAQIDALKVKLINFDYKDRIGMELEVKMLEKMVGVLGFEPKMEESKSSDLPLVDTPVFKSIIGQGA